MNKPLAFAGLAFLLLSFVSAQATPVPTIFPGFSLDNTSWMFVGLIVLCVIAYFVSSFTKFIVKFVAAGALILLIAHLLGLF
jgi:hypothetical protein